MTANISQHRRAMLASLAIAVVAVLVSGVLSVTLAGADSAKHHKPDVPTTVRATSAHAAPAVIDHQLLTVRGTTSVLLSPGKTDPVTLYVHNAGHQRETVTSATISVANASETCMASRNVRTTSYHLKQGSYRYVIRPHHTVTIPLSITLLDLQDQGTPGTPGFVSGNQNSCKSMSFPLTFHATAKVG